MREPIGARRAPSSGRVAEVSQSAAFFGRTPFVRRSVTVACAQVEPVVLDREASVERLAERTAEAAANGAELVVFPEAYLPAYPSSVWAKYLAGWADPRAKAAFARLAEESVEVPGPAADRLGEIAREHGVWLVTGVTEIDPERPGTLYNTLLYHDADGRARAPSPQARADEPRAAGLGPGRRPGPARDRDAARPARRADLLGELHAARALLALRVGRRDLRRVDRRRLGRVAGDARPHRARVARVRGRAVPLPAGGGLSGRLPARGGLRRRRPRRPRRQRRSSAPDGAYLAGPLYDEEGILYAELDPARLHEERQRFDPAGHYHRPDVLRLEVNAPPES